MTVYHHTGISEPARVTAGPDGALRFTISALNHSSIGQITTTGQVTIYTRPDINTPVGITARPNGTLWFADNSNSSIGRITTSVTP